MHPAPQSDHMDYTDHTDHMDWKAALWAGLIAGVVFMMMEMILVAVAGGGSPWGPPRMIAALVMGESVLPPPATFDLGITMVAMIIHFMLSIILGVALAWAISHWRLSLPAAVGGGVLLGLLVYIVGFYLLTPVFPWFASARGGIAIFAHTMFGLALGWSYHAIAGPDRLERGST